MFFFLFKGYALVLVGITRYLVIPGRPGACRVDENRLPSSRGRGERGGRRVAVGGSSDVGGDGDGNLPSSNMSIVSKFWKLKMMLFFGMCSNVFVEIGDQKHVVTRFVAIKMHAKKSDVPSWRLEVNGTNMPDETKIIVSISIQTEFSKMTWWI